MSELHPYHCDCDECDLAGDYPLRAQRDSSCSGEIISSPFDTMAEALPVMMALETAAVEVDAEPGYNAGFHVHVYVGDRSLATKANMLWSFYEWEAALRYIARGRFSSLRTMNQTVGSALAYAVRAWCEDHDRSFTVNYDDNSVYVARPTAVLREYLYRVHYENDRHSNLNIRTRHNTFEHRLWNSTRSAWRMQLWCELSLLFATPQTTSIPRPTAGTSPEEMAVELATHLATSGRETTAALLTRQLTYLATKADSTPESFVLA